MSRCMRGDRGQLSRVGSLLQCGSWGSYSAGLGAPTVRVLGLLQCGSWVSNSGCQALCLPSLPAYPSHQTQDLEFKLLICKQVLLMDNPCGKIFGQCFWNEIDWYCYNM